MGKLDILHWMCCAVFTHFSHVRLCDLWTVACQAPLPMGISRQEHWSELLCPPPGDLPDPGIKPTSLTSPALASGEGNGNPLQYYSLENPMDRGAW